MIVTAETKLTTPNYPFYYGNDVNCRWVIQAPQGQIAGVNVTHVILAPEVEQIEVNNH